MNDVRKTYVYGIVALTVLLCSNATADIYKCVEDGKAVYQDQPGRGPGSTIAVRPPASRSPDATSTAAQDSLSRLRVQVTAMEQERRKREISSEIERLGRDIQDYERAQDSELRALREKQGYANFNQPGALWERGWLDQSIASEMRDVTESYTAKIQAAQDRIAQLRKEESAIGKPAATRKDVR